MAEFERQRAAGAAAEAAVHERRVAAAALRTRAAGEAAFAAAKQARVVLAMASGGEGRTNVIELSADVLPAANGAGALRDGMEDLAQCRWHW